MNETKKASSGLYFLYLQYHVDLPKEGNIQIITDYDGKATAIIQTRPIDTIPFNQISKEYTTLDMGTHVESLKK